MPEDKTVLPIHVDWFFSLVPVYLCMPWHYRCLILLWLLLLLHLLFLFFSLYC